MVGMINKTYLPMNYLLLKTHKTTGLKYLCKTSRDDWERYSGSGKYWLLHLEKHGYVFNTELLFKSDDIDEFSKICLNYSSELKVVESNEYANLKPEDGLRGGDYVSFKSSEWKKWYSDIQSKKASLEWSMLKTERSKAISDGRKNMSEEEKNNRADKFRESYKDGSKNHIFAKYSKERRGSGNPNSKRIEIDNTVYNSIVEAMEALNLPRHIINSRCRSPKWKTYKQLD